MKQKFKLTLILEDGQEIVREIESTNLVQAKKNAWGIKKKCGAIKYTVVPFMEEKKPEPKLVPTATKTKIKKGGRGRKKLSIKFSRDEIKEQIKENLIKLQKAIEEKDLNEQKAIRRRLRRRGWKGGLSLKLEHFDEHFDEYISNQIKESA